MRWLLVFPIRIYRRIPSRFKRRCLYRETCSLFVLRKAREGGLLAGWRAFSQRFARCRPQYSVRYDCPTRDWIVMLADGYAATSAEIGDFVVEPYRAAIASVEARVRDLSLEDSM